VLIRPRIVRRLVIVVAVLGVSGAAAAMKLTSWTPASMCFCPTSDHPDSAVKSDSGIEAVAPSGGFKVPLDTSTTTAHRNSGAFGAAPGVELAETSSRGKGHAGGKRSWTPWGKHSSRRWASESTSGPSASLGSLWKMMSLAGRARDNDNRETTARVATSASARARAPKAPASPRPKAPTPISSPPSNSSSDAGASALAAPPAGSAFSEDSTPVAELVSGGSSSGATPGALGSGSSAARAAAEASNMSANPEPASFALIATGLLGIAGLIRRRRV
jgi:hypothetical protein